MTSKEKYHLGWRKTVLWFKLGISDQSPLEVSIWFPPTCPNEHCIEILQNVAGQVVKVIQNLAGPVMVIQGQYKTTGENHVYQYRTGD